MIKNGYDNIFKLDIPFRHLNPTLVEHNNKILMLARSETDVDEWVPGILSYKLVELDHNFKTLSISPMNFIIGGQTFGEIRRIESNQFKFCMEDIRLMPCTLSSKNGTLTCLGTAVCVFRPIAPRKIQQALVTVNFTDKTIKYEKQLVSDFMGDSEKNWLVAPFEYDDGRVENTKPPQGEILVDWGWIKDKWRVDGNRVHMHNHLIYDLVYVGNGIWDGKWVKGPPYNSDIRWSMEGSNIIVRQTERGIGAIEFRNVFNNPKPPLRKVYQFCHPMKVCSFDSEWQFVSSTTHNYRVPDHAIIENSYYTGSMLLSNSTNPIPWDDKHYLIFVHTKTKIEIYSQYAMLIDKESSKPVSMSAFPILQGLKGSLNKIVFITDTLQRGDRIYLFFGMHDKEVFGTWLNKKDINNSLEKLEYS
jgi:predicted GH43/DUF377 family glycosyl hydrolase